MYSSDKQHDFTCLGINQSFKSWIVTKTGTVNYCKRTRCRNTMFREKVNSEQGSVKASIIAQFPFSFSAELFCESLGSIKSPVVNAVTPFMCHLLYQHQVTCAEDVQHIPQGQTKRKIFSCIMPLNDVKQVMFFKDVFCIIQSKRKSSNQIFDRNFFLKSPLF